jgi:aspartyl-tRNA synthetase
MQRILVAETPRKIGEEVKVAGWVNGRRDHGKIIFIDLRDRSGILQVVFRPDDEKLYKLADTLRPEWVVEITGTMQDRPAGMENPKIPAGWQELIPSELKILSKAETLPFGIDGAGYDINEEIRLKHRYIDLRRDRLRENLVLRHEVIRFMRNWLGERGFVEVETPILTKSTPEGARDYVVPSRIDPGKFYALPQSPQQYKQLLMVAGLECYFQIARCFRDEDTRGDRQPEFTQLDIEMSFVEESDVLETVEALYIDTVRAVAPQKTISKIPFPRLTYKEVMEKYGTDKPDLRENPAGEQAPYGAGKDDPNELAFAFIVGFPMFEWRENEKRWDAVHHPFTKIRNSKFNPSTISGLTSSSLSLRAEGLSEVERAEIRNFDDEKRFIEYIKTNPGELFAHQYDFVCNGYEIGGGSIREHNPRILEAVFEIMGHTPGEVRQKFGHLLEAFSYGVPPHGGIAPGIDRFIMILANEPNIREVIAFPKTGDARDVMMDAPSEISEVQQKELHIQIKAPKGHG